MHIIKLFNCIIPSSSRLDARCRWRMTKIGFQLEMLFSRIAHCRWWRRWTIDRLAVSEATRNRVSANDFRLIAPSDLLSERETQSSSKLLRYWFSDCRLIREKSSYARHPTELFSLIHRDFFSSKSKFQDETRYLERTSPEQEILIIYRQSCWVELFGACFVVGGMIYEDKLEESYYLAGDLINVLGT